MDTLLQDLRYALRQLHQNPGFAAVAIVTLALGIGANTAIFSVVNGVMLRPLDYGEPDRIVQVHTAWEGSPNAAISPAEYFDFRDELDVFSALGVYAFGSVSLTGDGTPERLRGAFVSARVMSALGVSPALGRTFTDEEEAPGHALALLGHSLWERRFGAAPEVVGSEITLNGTAHVVIGVLPAGFRLPEDHASGETTELFVPLGIDRSTVPNRGSHFLSGVARLAPGVDVEQGTEAVRQSAARMVARFPGDYPENMRFTAEAQPLADVVVGSVRPALLVLLGAVGLVLLVACANIANLLLARANARSREFALRTALGAGRGRLLRQALTESFVLAAIGGAAGFLLAKTGTDLLLSLVPSDLPRMGEVSIDPRVIAFTGVTVLLTGLIFGLPPALLASGARAGNAGRRATGRGGRLTNALVAGEIAFALVLLTGAALLTRSFVELRRVDPGYRAENVLTGNLTLPASSYAGATEVTDFYARLIDRIEALPGVRAAGAVTNLPLATQLGDLNFYIEGREVAEGDLSPRADWQTVTPGYFDAMGMRLLRGRGIEVTDHEEAPGAVVINETLARRYWAGEEALGQRFVLGGGAGPGTVTVVGVVADVRHATLDQPANAEMYIPHAQFRFWDHGGPTRGKTLVIRAERDPAGLAASVRRELAALDPTLPIAGFRPMDEVVSAALAGPRFLMTLLGTFSILALVLGAVGIYGVMTAVVGLRTREIGIRLALGASRRGVLRLILRQGALLTAIGLVAGTAAALLLTRLLTSFLYGVAPADVATFIAVPLVLGAVALVASYLPALRATRVDPIITLRAE